jgi:hypothetical protein
LEECCGRIRHVRMQRLAGARWGRLPKKSGRLPKKKAPRNGGAKVGPRMSGCVGSPRAHLHSLEWRGARVGRRSNQAA